jgi:acyl carrier protein
MKRPMTTVVTAADLTAWLTAKVAEYTETAPDGISPSARLTDLGLDSIYALALCGDLEDDFGLVVEPTIIWDHPTVGELAGHLAERSTR